jgi:predicted ABC-type ATPase
VPAFYLIAGPNGSGKSTLTSSMFLEGDANLIDPDAIAKSMDPRQPSKRAIASARQAIRRCRVLLLERQTFTLESTLAGHGAIAITREAKSAGYKTLVVYVAMGDPELHIERVRLRVAQGGHDIPDADVRRRYIRSMSRAPEALRLADEALILDNSGFHPVRALLLKGGRIVWRAPALPEWVQALEAEVVAKLPPPNPTTTSSDR